MYFLYADDIVLLAESDRDLQKLLDELNVWVYDNNMTTSLMQTRVMLFILDRSHLHAQIITLNAVTCVSRRSHSTLTWGSFETNSLIFHSRRKRLRSRHIER